jgi:non-ribosomal peptide synthetase-like protein
MSSTARVQLVEIPAPRLAQPVDLQEQRERRAGGPRPAEVVLLDEHEAQGSRVRQDERLDVLFEQRCDWLREHDRADQAAVEVDGRALTYDELDAQSNRLARYLRVHGAGPGHRIGLLFDQPLPVYVGMLAVLKVGATYLPLDAAAPIGRTTHIVADAGATIVLSHSHLRAQACRIEARTESGAELLFLDEAAPLIGELNAGRLLPAERGTPGVAGIVYTAEPAERPSGVALGHPAIGNAVRVAAESAPIRVGDRVHQDARLVSDFAVDEIWLTWLAGATLVPGPAGAQGGDLHRFLAEQRITALYCPPTLLATIEADLPDLRFLLVAGEPCPPELIRRWTTPGRRIVTGYAPTEVAGTATRAEAHPDRPVTIGTPLPTYAAVVLDLDDPRRALPHGAIGEIGIAGLGLADGYLHADGPRAFVEDVLGIPGNPSGRILRTGDLGRITAGRELEYLGPIEGQIRIDGQRLDTTAITSALLGVPGVAGAGVGTDSAGELVGYYTRRADTEALDQQTVETGLRERSADELPPIRLVRLDELPLTAQGTLDRRRLPTSETDATATVRDVAAVEPATTVIDVVPPTGADRALADARRELARLRGENAQLAHQLRRLRDSRPSPAPRTQPGTASAPPRPAPSPRPAPGPATRVAVPAVTPAAPATSAIPVARTATPTVPVVTPPAAPVVRPPAVSAPVVAPRPVAPAGRPPAVPAPAVAPRPAPPAMRPPAPAPGFAPRAATPAPAAFAPAPPARPATPSPAPVEAGLAAVLADVLGVDTVPVDAHFFDRLGADSMVMAQFCARLRKRADLPSVSIKDIYRHSTIRGLATALAPVAPDAPSPIAAPTAAPVESGLAAVLADVLGVDTVPVDAHFFDRLGADSMVMAQFCARLRKRPELPTPAMKDIYRHPTVAGLARALGGAAAPSTPARSTASPAASARPAAAATPAVEPMPVPVSRSRPHYLLCGALQLLFFIGYPLLTTLVMARGLEWISAAVDVRDVYVRAAGFGAATFAAFSLLPIVVKWTLVGRWKPRQFAVWSLAYFRFWLVKTMIRTSPLVRFVGSPLYVLYLRALGAKIGRGVAILSPTVPVCTDLLTVGAGSVIRKDSTFTGYRAHNGLIQTGPVTLGRGVYIGETTVLDIGTTMGDGAQLGHSSSLHLGQVVPAGQRWHGSPAEPTTVDYRMVQSSGRGRLRRFLLPILQLSLLFGVVLPLALGGAVILFREVPQLAALVGALPTSVTSRAFYLDALLLAAVLFWGGVLLGLLVLVTVPRLLRLFVRPDRDYKLYGIHYWMHRAVARMTNRKFYTRMFGDSSFIVGYLSSIGYSLFQVQQTGSNFGTDVKHETPFLCSVGSGTVVADGLSIVNADYSDTHFRVTRVSIGAHNFLGNKIAYPAQGRTGHNCLLATKVMVPMDGRIREGVGLLGSPSFEIPRTVERDHQLDVTDPAELHGKLRAKNRHNAFTILLFLLSRWVLFSALTVLALATIDLYSEHGVLAVAVANVATLLFTVGYFVLLDRLVRGLQAHRPTGCSIYDKAFWRHERFWKICADAYLNAFNGTPFKNLIWRLLGVRMGRRVFDDGCFLTERSFVAIGQGATLNAGSVIQCHSQEDGAFKSDRTVIGAGATLGVNAFVHYGVQVGACAMVEPDSFLMKGEEVSPYSWWGGNPAMEIDDDPFGIHRNREDRT